MSETTTPAAETPVTETAPVAAQEPAATAELDLSNLPADHPLVKAYNAQKEELKQLRPLQSKARQWDEYTEQNKTELQKAQEAAATAANEAAQARLDALRARTAATAGVPEELLVGSNEEELVASVQKLLAFKGTEQPAAPRSSGTDAPAGAAKPTVYRAEQLNDPAFFQAHRADILKAYAEGGTRILS
jgi:hypothetical protein